MLRGLYLKFAEGIDRAINIRLQALTQCLLENPLAALSDIIPAYNTIYLEYDDALVSAAQLECWLERCQQNMREQRPARVLTLPVIYNGEDLDDIAEQTGLSRDEVIRQHSQTSYHVYAVGFTPGFPFMAEVPEALRLPRKAIPRMRVEANTVAMTGMQTGIYGLASPGGWNLLGKLKTPLFDPHRAEAFLLRAGDEVRFLPADGEAAPEPERLELLPKAPAKPVFKVLKPGLLDLLVDRGRFMAGRYGLARGAALDAPLAHLANQLLANPPDAALLELTLMGPVLECLGPSVVALTGRAVFARLNGKLQDPFSSFVVKKGDILSFQPGDFGVRSYLAIAGGIASEQFMGSASVDLKGYIGSPLKTGDIVGRAGEHWPLPGRRFEPYERVQQELAVRIYAGPQASEVLVSSLTKASYRVLSADRMGIRLEGPALGADGIISEAAPIGAVQLTSGGMPIILLNDRGTLGGYAKPAIVHPADLPKLAQLRQGARLRFVLDEQMSERQIVYTMLI